MVERYHGTYYPRGRLERLVGPDIHSPIGFIVEMDRGRPNIHHVGSSKSLGEKAESVIKTHLEVALMRFHARFLDTLTKNIPVEINSQLE